MVEQEIMVHGVKTKIVTKVDEDFIEKKLVEEDLEKTTDLSNVLDNTMKIDVGEIND